MHTEADTARVLRDAAALYKVDIESISAQVRQEFAAKERVKATKKAAQKPPAKAQPKATKNPAAA